MTLIRYTRRPLARRATQACLADLADDEFEGYASLFGVPDSAGDVVVRGAFAASLRRRPPEKVRMLYQHSALEPIGVWEEIKEDARGLYVRGRLVLDVARAREVRSLIAEGALNGLSIGFRTLRAQRGSATRLLTEIELWEISVVTFPLLAGSLVTAVGGKSAPFSATIRKAAHRLTQTVIPGEQREARKGTQVSPTGEPRRYGADRVFEAVRTSRPGSPLAPFGRSTGGDIGIFHQQETLPNGTRIQSHQS